MWQRYNKLILQVNTARMDLIAIIIYVLENGKDLMYL
jgi:hypothetical protein